jgi:hypothetical protein
MKTALCLIRLKVIPEPLLEQGAKQRCAAGHDAPYPDRFFEFS